MSTSLGLKAIFAQTNGEEYQGHFVDQFVDAVTAPEAGDRLVDWLRVGIEWLVIIAMIVIPLALIVGGIRSRRYNLAGGGLIALLAMWWYRSRPTEIVSSGTTTFTDENGDTFECLNATVDADGELIECSSGLIAQIRQNTVLDLWQIPVGSWVEQTVYWVENNLKETLEVIKWPFARLLELIVDDWLAGMSWLTVCIAVFFLGWALRNLQVGVLSFVGLLICALLGEDYWKETVLTIGFIGVAVLLCVIVGIPIGVLCGRVDGAWQVVRPVLDAMQVVHSFVYMLPFIFFFGIGFVSATMVTMTFALPPLIRLTNLGIRQVPEDVVEAARAYGAPERRVLFDVQLPLARPAIMTGLNQTLLLSISMLGIAAIMGAGGLGRLLYQGIQNQDIALGGSGGLAFFLVAVVLDRISQTDADSSNLFSRIGKAWANRRTPEKLLEEAQAAADDKVAKLAAAPEVPDEPFVAAPAAERRSVLAVGIGGLLMLVSLLLPWSQHSGRISSYSRSSDLDLASASFNGVSASGGSWFGIFMAITAAVVIVAAGKTLWRPGEGSTWFSVHGTVLLSMASLGSGLAFLLASPPDDVVRHSVGIGAVIAVLGGVIAAAGSVAWLWKAPMSARRPLTSRIGWGRMVGCVFALLLLVIGGFSGWSFDNRAGTVFTPEIEAALAEIEAEAAAKAELAREFDAAADEAEEAGDLASAQELRSAAIEAKAEEGVLAADWAAKRAEVSRIDVVTDGFSQKGTGLAVWTLIGGVIALGLALPAIGVFGIGESLRYRWSTLVGGVGLAIAMVPVGWIASTVRVAHPNYVVGVGVVFVLAAGGTILASSRSTLAEFERDKSYDDLSSHSQTNQDEPASAALEIDIEKEKFMPRPGVG